MIEIPKRYVRPISWINILLGSLFLIFTIIGSLAVLLDVVSLPPASSIWDNTIEGSMSILLILSGYTILNSKKDLKYKGLISWLSIILGCVSILAIFVSILFPTFIEISKTVVALSLIVLIPKYLLLTISGFFLRKIG